MGLETPITQRTKLRQRNLIRLPEAMLMVSGLNKGDEVDVTIGKNFNCVVITPAGMTLAENMRERVRILTSEPLDSGR